MFSDFREMNPEKNTGFSENLQLWGYQNLENFENLKKQKNAVERIFDEDHFLWKQVFYISNFLEMKLAKFRFQNKRNS